MNFSDMDVARAHLIRDLKGDFGVNDEGVDIILHLVDQLHGLRRAFAQLHRNCSRLCAERLEPTWNDGDRTTREINMIEK